MRAEHIPIEEPSCWGQDVPDARRPHRPALAVAAMSRTHPCPGCTTPVRPAMYACGGCWRRLPPGHRTDILRAWGRRQRGVEGATEEHEDAKASAAAWFEGHPR